MLQLVRAKQSSPYLSPSSRLKCCSHTL
jgi:hypothetical protein